MILHERLTHVFGGRTCTIEFLTEDQATRVRVAFDSDDVHSVESHEQGWMAILSRFKAYVEESAFNGRGGEPGNRMLAIAAAPENLAINWVHEAKHRIVGLVGLFSVGIGPVV